MKASHGRILLGLVAIIASACDKKDPPAALAVQAPVVSERRGHPGRSSDADPANWPSHGRTQGEQRFSPLKQISSANVKDLRLAWYLDLPPGERGQASTPLVIDGVMFVTTSWSRVIALEAATGKVLWRHDPKVPREWGVNACCDVVNRGVAFWDGKVYLGTLDGRLVALNAADGRQLWEALVIDRAERASITGAPRVIKGRVYIGSAGGEFGVRGRMTAVDAATGAIVWRFFSVPGDPSIPVTNAHLQAAQRTWSGEWWKRGGGGTVWDAMAHDPDRDLLYIGTGNGSPWPRSLRSPDGGDNLYVSSIIALRPHTGEYIWHYQTTPGDEWGFDAASQLVLTELTIEGQRRSVLIQAAANGFVYVLDRTSGRLISATPFVPVNWAAGVDLQTGRPHENPAARYSTTQKPFVVHPGPQGAHSWHPMAFNPDNGLLYIPAMLNAAELSVSRSPAPSQYTIDAGVTVRRPAEAAPDSSRLIAWDPVQKKAIWSLDRATPVSSGVLTTGGSLVFQGSTEGRLEAFHSDTGKTLWSAATGASITAAPITYEADGTQMLAVVAGAGGSAHLHGGALAAQHVLEDNTPRLLAFSLKGSSHLPPREPSGPPAPAPERFGTDAQVENGKALYARYCARCHGEDVISAGPLADLRTTRRLADSEEWRMVVFAGALRSEGMPAFAAELDAADVEDLRAYVVNEAHTKHGRLRDH